MKKNSSMKELMQKLGTLAALIILCAIFCIMMPFFNDFLFHDFLPRHFKIDTPLPMIILLSLADKDTALYFYW